MTYDVFMCHSMRDGELAGEISRGIARRARGRSLFTLGDRLRVFQASDLSAGADVSREIFGALETSRFLVFIASPAAAESEWVTRELEYWLRSRSRDSILVVLAEGTPETSFPSILTDFRETLWIDLRWTQSTPDFAERPEFVDAIASLTAVLRGITKDAVLNEQSRQQRQIRRFAVMAILALVVTAVIAASAFLRFIQVSRELEAALAHARMEQQRAAAASTARAVAQANEVVAKRRAMEARETAKAAEERVNALARELAKLRKQGGTEQAFRAYEEEINGLKTRIAELTAALDASSAARANAEQRLARTLATAAEYERQLKARTPPKEPQATQSSWSRAAAILKPYTAELISAAIGLLVLLTLSTRWILLLLRLEFKPITAVAVPLYLTRLGRWRLFRQYRKRVLSRDVASHVSCYLDLPFVSNAGTPAAQPLEQFITSQIGERNIAIIAGGGGGKTTLCHRIVVGALENEIKPNGKRVIPVVVDGLAYDGNLLRTITDTLVNHGVAVNTSIVDAQLTAGILMVIFDGWSEVRAFVDAYDETADAPTAIKRYPDARFVFTSRIQLPATLRLALRDPIAIELQDIDQKTARVFVERYLNKRVGEAHALIKKLADSPLPLPFTPLMLRLVAEVFERIGHIPTQRTQLFDEYFQQLFREDAPIEPEAVEYIVKHLTRYTYLANHGRRGFPVYRGVQLLDEIKGVLSGFRVQSLPIDLLKMLSGSGLYKKSGDRLRCFHDSFESYFAAKVLYDEFNEGRYEGIVACASDVTFLETYQFLIEKAIAEGESGRMLEMIEQTRAAMQPAPAVGFRAVV